MTTESLKCVVFPVHILEYKKTKEKQRKKKGGLLLLVEDCYGSEPNRAPTPGGRTRLLGSWID